VIAGLLQDGERARLDLGLVDRLDQTGGAELLGNRTAALPTTASASSTPEGGTYDASDRSSPATTSTRLCAITSMFAASASATTSANVS